MATFVENYQKRRLISSYFWVIVSIFLVLFLLGLLGLFVLNAKKVSDYFKEQVPISIYFSRSANPTEISQLEKSLSLADYTKEATYISKETAAENYLAETGENFMEFLGENPLQDMIEVHLNADYVTETQIDEIIAELKTRSYIDDIVYERPLVGLINNNVKKISFWMLVISGVFILIAVLLINSSIRLSVYSKRFLIKTMQLVGATKKFIRAPFVLRSMRLGFIGAVLAIIGLGIVVYFLNQSFPELALMSEPILLAALAGGVLLIGLLIVWISTWLATQRYLNLKADALY